MNADTEVCLGVAVDHRIRRLCKPVAVHRRLHSGHVARIEARGRALGLGPDEIQVTAQLAGPAYKGGIAVVLQQPRSNHPFHKGTDAVIEDCETLSALRRVFYVVSCGSLNMKADVTVVDLLPFVPDPIARISDAKLRDSFRVAVDVVCDREPDVLVCAGQIWTGKFDDRKADARKLESLGVGKQFGSGPSLPLKAKIRHENRALISISRVNGFHPSYAMNYHPHKSALRQLLLLVGVEACGTVRDDWENEGWMNELRLHSLNISKQLSTTSPPASPPQSPGQSPARSNTRRFLPDYQALYTCELIDIMRTARDFLLSAVPNETTRQVYDALLECRMSEKCNDASLLLREMVRLVKAGWPASIDWKNQAALTSAANDTLKFSDDMIKLARGCRKSTFGDIIEKRGCSLYKQVSAKTNGVKTLDLSSACVDFLDLAVDVESMLLDFLLRSEKERASAAEGLSSLMGGLHISPSLATTQVQYAAGRNRSSVFSRQ